MQHSCDCYFYHLGKTVGVDFMDESTELFGFGTPTGIDLPGEKAGFRPARESKRRAVERFRTGVDPTWYPGDTINASIGQGVVLSTPLQVAAMTAMVANGGTLWRPRLVLEVRNRSGETTESRPPEAVRREAFDRQALRAVIEGMDRVVNEPGGTAYGQRLPGITVCGKTGTAQNEDRENAHAWFTCFAPREDPEIVVTVLCLWSGHGGSVAGPKAREILERYFAGERDEVSYRGPAASAGGTGL
jgi:penicillin-binding protein 2